MVQQESAAVAARADETAAQRHFRDGMANVVSAVCVVTSAGPAGRLGFTATAVCSVTDAPPTLLVCMNRESTQNRPLRRNGVLCVNALSSQQQHLSSLFAGGSQDMKARFGAAQWAVGRSGSPCLLGATATFDCEIDQLLEVGTHTVLFARVLDARTSTQSALVYYNRSYHGLGNPQQFCQTGKGNHGSAG